MINIIFITKDIKLRQEIEKPQPLFPENILSSRNEKAITTVFHYNNTKTEDIDSILSKLSSEYYAPYNGVIIICDNSLYDNLVFSYGLSFLVNTLGNYSYNDNSIRHHLQNKITFTLNAYFRIKTVFIDNNSELMRLPYKNFTCPELIGVFDQLRNGVMINDWRRVEKEIKSIKEKIRKPLNRGKRKGKEINFVDNKDYWFSLGDEIHLKHETSQDKGHSNICDISARFRFGHKIDHDKHFNVKYTERKDSKISGEFVNCHGEGRYISKASHINMHSSDYYVEKYK